MDIKFVFLWSDILIYVLILSLCIVLYYLSKHEYTRSSLYKIFCQKVGLISFLVLCFYVTIALLDSIHFQKQVSVDRYSNKIYSVLDSILSPWDEVDEVSYSSPFAKELYQKSNIKGQDSKLIYVTSSTNVFKTIIKVIIENTFIYVLCLYLVILMLAKIYNKNNQKSLCISWRTIIYTIYIITTLFFILLVLSKSYHIFGTDKIGQDVFYKTLKSIRTAMIIGTLTTLFMLPFACVFGICAGFFGGKVDDIIQYIYTTLSSVPSVLLISAMILILQTQMNIHPEWFPNNAFRADIRLIALCAILGITSWSGLCRLLRAETYKLREMDYVNAAKVLGVSKPKIMIRHIFPNLMHIILITIALSFSGLVLSEAVLSYVGIGVDPSTYSFGNMINAARLELAREPVVWWSISAAFVFMFILILSANLFSDSVRNAFDPKLN